MTTTHGEMANERRHVIYTRRPFVVAIYYKMSGRLQAKVNTDENYM